MTGKQTIFALAVSAAFLAMPDGARAALQGEVSGGSRGYTETIEHVVSVRPGGTLRVDTDQGGIEIETWSRDEIRIVVEKETDESDEDEARQMLRAFVIDLSDESGSIVLSGDGPRSDDVHASFEITVPDRFSVDLTTGGGGITVDDLTGHVTVKTGGGGIDIGQVTDGDVHARTGGGGIDIEGITGGSGFARTGGGGIDVGSVTGDLEVKTGGGGISVGRVGGTLTLDTGGGGLNVSNTGGAVIAETGGGGISIDGTGGPVEAETGGGGVTVKDAGGKVVVDTGGGGIRIENTDGPVEADTGGGGVSVKDAMGYIEVSTGGGGIEAELVLADPGADTHVDLRTGGGDITLTVPGNLRATVDAEVRLDDPDEEYSVSSDFDGLRIDNDGSERLVATGELNGGGDVLYLRTTNGDIRIKRR